MKIFTSKKQKIGLIGEQIAEMFLVKQGFNVISRNFSCRFGEIDIIAVKNSKIYFFEIKTLTVSCETNLSVENLVKDGVSREMSANSENDYVSHETLLKKQRRMVSRETFILENRKLTNPFQNISKSKIRRFLKTIDIYLAKNSVPRETRWQADGIGVFLDRNHKLLKIDHLPNIGIF